MGIEFGKASEVYSQSIGKEIQTLIPRSRFQFSAKIKHIDLEASDFASGSVVLTETDFTRIASITMPSHSANSSVLNQYNRKRVVQTGITYNPITMVAYDTRDAYVEKFLSDVSSYYYSNTRVSPDPLVYTHDVAKQDFTKFGLSHAGLKSQTDKYFIKELTIERIHSIDDISLITIYNPVITTFSTDTLDYADSNPVTYTITFEYEGYNIESKSDSTDRAKAEKSETSESSVGLGSTQQALRDRDA